MADQGEVHFDALLDGWIGEPLSDTASVGFVGNLFADLGKVVLAVGVLNMNQQLGPFPHEVSPTAEQIAGGASEVTGVKLVAALHDGDAGELRELAQGGASRLENANGAAVVLGSARGGSALIVAACSKNLVGRGVTAPLLLEPAALAIGGRAGGKPILGTAGGPNGAAVKEAVERVVPERLEQLLRALGTGA